MATQGTAQAGTVASARSGFRPSFHLAMVLVMCAFVFGGFGMTYLGPLASDTFPPAPPIVHLHGVVFFSWMVLLVVQSALVNARNVKAHRSLGLFGIAVATLVVTMGMFITLAGMTGVGASFVGDAAPVFFLSVVAPPSFAVLFVMAIRAVKTPLVHRNLILIATIAILMPGINRVYMNGVGLDYVPVYKTYLTMDVLLAAVLWHEWRLAGRVSRATWIGAAIVVVPQFLLAPVSASQEWLDVVHALGSLVYYR